MEKNNRALLFLVLLPALLLVALIASRKPKERPGGSEKQQAEIAAAIVKEWASKHYIYITNRAEFEPAIEKLTSGLTTNQAVTPAMATSLSDSLKAFINAYHAGTFESYMDFRLPRGVDYTMRDTAVERINSYFLEYPQFSPLSDSFDRYWYGKYKKSKFTPPDSMQDKFKIYLQDFGGRTFYSNYLSAVCFDEAVIRVDTHRFSLPAPLDKYPFFEERDPGGFSVLAPFPNIGMLRSGYYAVFDFAKTPSVALKEQGQLVTANCFMFTRVNDPENYKPILLRFYWVNSLNRWLIEDLVDANLKVHSDYMLLL